MLGTKPLIVISTILALGLASTARADYANPSYKSQTQQSPLNPNALLGPTNPGALSAQPATPFAAPDTLTTPVNNNAATAPGTNNSPPVSSAAMGGPTVPPLLDIRFDQHHVYFDHALRDAITTAERTRAGTTYEVISYVPSGQGAHSPGDPATQNARINTGATENLRAVVQGMHNMGIPDSRIRTSTQSSPNVSSQEVQIFAK